jgi:cytosine deaminase
MVSQASWPSGKIIHLANASVPAALIDPLAPGVPDANGLKRLDIIIDDGTVAGLLPAGSQPVGPRFDARAGQIWPTFADLHTHLDKGQIWQRAMNPDGRIETARALVRADTIARWTADDVAQRFEFSLRSAYAHGTSAIRTHIDCFVHQQAGISFEVFRRLRDKWAGKVDLQAVAMVSTDLYDLPENAALVDLIADVGARLGGITFRLTEEEDPKITEDRLERLFDIAQARNLDIDLHVDENGSPASRTLAQIARIVLRRKFRGQVVCGHCCSLSVQDEATVRETLMLLRDAGIIVVSLPLVNLCIQGRRDGGTPQWRGITLLRELLSAGVKVVLASDNCRDPYHPFGDLDGLEVLGQSIKIGQLDAEFGSWVSAVNRVPFDAMGMAGRGTIKIGASADFIAFEGRNYSEIFSRPQSDRIVIRSGRAIDTSLPSYSELDHLA